MSLAQNDPARLVVFVCRKPSGEDLRCAGAIARLAGIRLLGVCERLPDEQERQSFLELACVGDARDPDQLTAAVHELRHKHGALDQVVTSIETLLEPVAAANEALGLRGMRVTTVRRALDKPLLKAILSRAGIGTARDQVVASAADARRVASELGLPIVLKPVGGSGGLATWRIRDLSELELALELMQLSAENPVLAEEHLQGQELCIDTIAIDSEPRFFSICCYRPSIMEALEDAAIQWSCVMPREQGAGDKLQGTRNEFREFIEQGLEAVRTLEVGNAMTHMEGFLLREGGVRFTDATLRPAGARIGPMLGFACDVDPYRAWARVAVDACFDGPWERKWAVGTVFLRGIGSGSVEHVEGIEYVKRSLGQMLVDARLPQPRAVKSVSYTGDGYVTVRHPETQAVEDGLDLIARTIRITYSRGGAPARSGETRDSRAEALRCQWRERLGYRDKQLYRPTWEN